MIARTSSPRWPVAGCIAVCCKPAPPHPALGPSLPVPAPAPTPAPPPLPRHHRHERLVRVERLRWEYGAVLPARWSARLSRKEEDYAKAYGDALAEYMRSVDMDVTADVQPPRQLHVLVRVRRALGEVVLASGQAVNMQPGTTLLLRRSDAEALVRRGALEEVDADS